MKYNLIKLDNDYKITNNTYNSDIIKIYKLFYNEVNIIELSEYENLDLSKFDIMDEYGYIHIKDIDVDEFKTKLEKMNDIYNYFYKKTLFEGKKKNSNIKLFDGYDNNDKFKYIDEDNDLLTNLYVRLNTINSLNCFLLYNKYNKKAKLIKLNSIYNIRDLDIIDEIDFVSEVNVSKTKYDAINKILNIYTFSSTDELSKKIKELINNVSLDDVKNYLVDNYSIEKGDNIIDINNLINDISLNLNVNDRDKIRELLYIALYDNDIKKENKKGKIEWYGKVINKNIVKDDSIYESDNIDEKFNKVSKRYIDECKENDIILENVSKEENKNINDENDIIIEKNKSLLRSGIC